MHAQHVHDQHRADQRHGGNRRTRQRPGAASVGQKGGGGLVIVVVGCCCRRRCAVAGGVSCCGCCSRCCNRFCSRWSLGGVVFFVGSRGREAVRRVDTERLAPVDEVSQAIFERCRDRAFSFFFVFGIFFVFCILVVFVVVFVTPSFLYNGRALDQRRQHIHHCFALPQLCRGHDCVISGPLWVSRVTAGRTGRRPGSSGSPR